VVQEDIVIDLPDERDRLNTRALPRFTELRHHVYEQIRIAKKGHRPASAGVN
jgi:NitT/TauT family transport system ATP-binding protein